MADLVVDANVLEASLLESDSSHGSARIYVQRLRAGSDVFHLSMLLTVEVVSAIWRRTQKEGLALVTRVRMSLRQWEAAGNLVLYPLSHERTLGAMDAAIKYKLSGADSAVASLADELDMPLRTFDSTLQTRVPRASP